MVERDLADSIDKAQRMIMAGEVLVANKVIDKPSQIVTTSDQIRLRHQRKFVSRGGTKLATALNTFPVKVRNCTAIDVGASTGGFTDCLLQNGAKQVFAIDVGYGDLAWSLRQDPRVKVLERTNIRHLVELPLDETGVVPKADLAVVDTSFISLKVVLPATLNLLKASADIIALVKPQFEAEKTEVEKGGVVTNPRTHERVLEEVIVSAQKLELKLTGLIKSPIRGPAGNIEFLLWMTSRTNAPETVPKNDHDKLNAFIRKVSEQSETF